MFLLVSGSSAAAAAFPLEADEEGAGSLMDIKCQLSYPDSSE